MNLYAAVSQSTPNVPTNEDPSAASWIITFLPLILLVPFLVLILRLMRNNANHVKRALLHMDRMEEKTDRVISLLASIRDDLAKRER